MFIVLSLCNLEAAPEEAMQLRRLIKSSNESLGPYLFGKIEFWRYQGGDVLKMGYTSSPLFLDKIQEAWAKIISDAPDTVIKELAAAVHHTYGQRRHISLNSGWANGNRFGVYEKRKNNFYEIRPSPLNMAAACNLQSSCKYIIQ